MAKVISYDPAKLPAPVAAPSKYDTALLAQYVSLTESGKAAGDGEAYEDKKSAVAAANSIKRAIRKHLASDISLQMRVWQDGEVFRFALSTNTRPLTGAAAAARGQSAE